MTSRERAMAVLPMALVKLVPDAMQNRRMRSCASSSAAIAWGLRREVGMRVLCAAGKHAETAPFRPRPR